MSSGDLQEMEVGTKQSKTAVNSGAKPADPMPTMADPGTQLGSVEDLGGPTPENYKPDDDSAKLKEPGATLKQVKDVVNKGAKPADSMPKMANPVKEEEEIEDEVVAEEETAEEEVVAEEETTEEETVAEEEEVIEYDIEEDVNALLAGEELSEEFQEKAKVIFETAINAKVSQIQVELEEKYSSVFAEEVETFKGELSERVDSYLEYVADEWFQENALVIDQGLKTEMTESFLSGMKDLFEAHYVEIPEDKYDVVHSMVDKLDDMETKLNEQIEKNVSLNKRLAESVADGILDQVSDGLAQTQKEKLASLAESVEFESEEEYREKLETLKESYFAPKKQSSSAKTETLSEGVSNDHQQYSGSMSAYVRALGSTVK
tara:strand:+ start:7336 stop:8463 length:1128 start_codon:yes stop_codon:yes gene_type:complete